MKSEPSVVCVRSRRGFIGLLLGNLVLGIGEDGVEVGEVGGGLNGVLERSLGGDGLLGSGSRGLGLTSSREPVRLAPRLRGVRALDGAGRRELEEEGRLRASDNVVEPDGNARSVGGREVLVDGDGGASQAAGDLEVGDAQRKDVALVEGIKANASRVSEVPPRVNDGVEGREAELGSSGLVVVVGLRQIGRNHKTARL